MAKKSGYFDDDDEDNDSGGGEESKKANMSGSQEKEEEVSGGGGGGDMTIKSNDSGKYFYTAFRSTFQRARPMLDLSFSPSLALPLSFPRLADMIGQYHPAGPLPPKKRNAH